MNDRAISEEWRYLQQMADAIEAVFWLVEINAPQILYVSPAYERLWGRDRQRLYTNYEEFIKTVHPDDRKRVQAASSRCVAQKRFEVEYRIVRPDGEVRWVRDRGFLIQQAGVPDRLAGFAEDITATKQTEQTLRQSEAQLREVAANLPNGAVFIVDRQLRYQLAEGAAIKLAGMNSKDLVGKTLWEAIDPALADAYEPFFRQALRGEPYTLEHHSHGRDYVSHGTPLVNEQGEIYGVLAVSYDISDRKRVEEELARSRRQLEKIAETTPDLVYVYDLVENRNLYVNAGISRILGYTPKQIAAFGSSMIASLIHPDDIPGVLEGNQRFHLLGDTDVYDHELRMRHAQGNYRWLRCRDAVFERAADGTVTQIIGTAQDVTERKQAEAAIAADLRDTQRLRDLSAKMIGEGDIQTLYQEIISTAIALTHADAGAVQILDDATQELVLLATQGLIPKMMEHFYRVNASSNTSCGIALRNNERTFVDFDVPASEDLDGSCRMHVEAGYLSAQSTPLISHSGKAIGMVTTYWREHRRPSDRELRFLDLLVRQAADLIEQRQSEQALRESEQRLQRAIAIETVGVIFLSTDGRITDANDTFLQMSGYRREDVAQGLLRWDQLTPSEWMSDSRQAIAQLEATGHTTPYEKEYLRKDGSRWWGLFAATRLNESEAVEFIIDISDRKRVEAALRQSEADFRTLADNISQFVWTADANGWIFWYNRRWFDYTGTTLEEMQGWGWQKVHHPDHVERVVTHIRHCFKTGEPWEDTFPLRGKDGTYRWFLSRAIPIRDERRILCWFGTNTDITERKQAEEALCQSESRFRLMVESAKDYAIFTLDLNGMVTSWNSGAERLLGYSESEIIGCHSRLIFTPEDNEQGKPEQEMEAALTQGRAENERWHVRQDGSRFWGSGLVTPLLDESGTTQGFVKIMQDKTAQRQIEAEREHLLQQEQAARQEAERANRIKDEFLAVLSHELRSPLNPILGWSQLLQRGGLDETRQQEALATIERNAQLQLQLIEDLLDISRIMRGKLALVEAPVNLVGVIAAAVETVRLAAHAKNIEIALDLGAVAPLWGDAARLQQVVWNLLSNAVKFTPQGGQVTVELRQIEGLAQIRVVDTGKGIDPSFLPYVFEYFRQEDSSTTRQFGGLGLGLAIVRQIVEMHGGTVSAASQGNNQGATFIVQLPVLQTTSSIPEPDQTQAERLEKPLAHLQILVVDDLEDTREFQTVVLEQSGAQVRAVASGFEALQVLDQFIPDVIVSDIGMPEMDGYTLIGQIRSRPPEQGGTIRAIALSAYAGDAYRQQALQSGFQRHLSKPIKPEQLVETIIRLLEDG